MRKIFILLISVMSLMMLSGCDLGSIDLIPKDTNPSEALNPHFSHQGGFFETAFELILTPVQGTTIHFTIDGTDPTSESNIYLEPLLLTDQTISGTQSPQFILHSDDIPRAPISWIVSATEKWVEPVGEIFAGTVIKAIAYDAQGHKSEIVTHTYFVTPETENRYSFPVIALSTDPMNLFDFASGIHIPGKAYDPNVPQGTSNRTGNYFQSGDAWERPVTFEMFDRDGLLVIHQEAGIRIHGGLSRKYPIKSYRLYARKEYDESSSFQYPFFKDRELETYKRLILRAGGQAYEYTFMGEALAQSLLEPLDLDIQYSTPVILFINGEYFGIRNLRDRYDTRYLETLYGIPENQSTILTGHAYLEDGSRIGSANYMSMYRYATTKDMSHMAHYRHVETQMDIDNFIDYYIAQLYFANKDWPQNNILYWKKNVSYQKNAPYGHDGRWRWMVYDVDAGFAASWGGNSPSINSYEPLTGETWKTGKLFMSLLENDVFKAKFAYRLDELMETVLNPDRVVGIINATESLYQPEMEEHIRRWGYPTSMDTWRFYVERMRTFALDRPSYLKDHTKDLLNYGQMDEMVVSFDDSKGVVQLHDYKMLHVSSTISIYKDLKLYAEAIPKDGYRLQGWYDEGGNLISRQKAILMDASSLDLLEARFEPGWDFSLPLLSPWMVRSLEITACFALLVSGLIWVHHIRIHQHAKGKKWEKFQN